MIRSLMQTAAWRVAIMLLGSLSVANAVAAELRVRAPLDFQVTQRRSARTGTLTVVGECDGPAEDRRIVEVRLLAREPNPPWQQLVELAPGQTNFQTGFSAPAGGWYRLEVRVCRGPSTMAEAAVAHVGLGEIFVVVGQSNSANHGAEKQAPGSDRVVAFTGRSWQPARDPQPGASGSGGSFLPPLGDALAAQFDVPIGLVALGVGATSVREWLPAGARFPQPPTLTGNVTQVSAGEWASRGTLFQNFTNRLRGLGPAGFRAALWHQGESDANQRNPTNTLSRELYRQYLGDLIRAARRDVGWNFPWFVAQATYHTPDDPGSPSIRAAQADLWATGLAMRGPDTDALRGEWRDEGGRGVHFSGPGLRAHAAAWAERIIPWLTRELAQPAAP